MEDPAANPLLDRIRVDADFLGGKPRVRGTRLGVQFLLGLMAGGWTDAVLLEEYPGLEEEDLRACIAYAAVAVEHFRMVPTTA